MGHPREPPPRLNIPPPSLNAQQPVGGMFSPALPTALQQGFHPPFPHPNTMQTPMQPFFNPLQPHAPSRPMHHPGQASVAQLAAAGTHHPNGFPMTPVTGHFSRPSLLLGPGQLQPFPHRNRRQPSIGGPPKAILGGPARKLSPIPPGASISPALPPKAKKVTVNLPTETISGEGEGLPMRPAWARTPLKTRPDEEEQVAQPVELITRESYPPDEWRRMMPEVVDVFLPGKLAWDHMKRQVIEEKLGKLGVEPGSGSSIPHIYAPHARAASVSSPADPNILLYKLNQLQQSRDSSAFNSLSASPQPPFRFSPSPHQSAQSFAPPRHTYSMSLAQPSSYLLSPYEESISASTNPFGHDAVLGNDQPQVSSPFILEKVPSIQTGASLSIPVLPPPLSAVQLPDGRPDFIRGFGLDIPEEDEEDEELYQSSKRGDSDTDATQDMDLDEGDQKTHSYSHKNSPFQSRHHSRHTSKISAHLSLGSFGANDLIPEILNNTVHEAEEAHSGTGHVVADDVDAVGEWTGTDTSEDDESIGEWSNPSDEERARRERVQRRLSRRAAKLSLDKPRRIPNFPRPPNNKAVPSLAREGDIISNPSEENLMLGHQEQYLGVEPHYFSPSRSSQVLTHSRGVSAEYSVHDPAQAHSRTPSDNFVYPEPQHYQHSSFGKRDLNPFAKPFVFGPPLASSSPIPATALPNISISVHSRLPSYGGKPLNVSAPEFKPSGFTFRPPPGVPQMPAPLPEFPTLLPPPPVRDEGSPFVLQGREKRQRRGSTASMEEGDSMASFKFPRDVDSPRGIRRATSYSGSHHLNPSPEPFTFAGFSAVAQPPAIPREPEGLGQHPITPEEITLQDDSAAKAKNVDDAAEECNIPSSSKKRAPIPLDFKRPVSSNTVPAGLFKALANGDERTRRGVRSRLGSREINENHHRRPSMDDNDVPQISHQRSQRHLAASSKDKTGSLSDDDVFGASRHARRRSSLPNNLHDGLDTASPSQASVPPMDLTSRMELHHVEHVIGGILDARFAELRREISQKFSKGGQALNPSTEAQITDVISLFRTQLQESATRSLEDAQMDARGEMDFQLIREVVEQGQKELLALVKRELRGVSVGRVEDSHGNDVAAIVENVGDRIIGFIHETISDFSARQEAISRAAPAPERDALIDKLVVVLTPLLAPLRPEPLDYDFLTSQLTQSVKPHIAQLIDLASDKRETASLIVESLLPLLPPMQGPAIDTDAIILELTTEVRRAIAPIDAFEIKEQVADLVVERLDSRLAVRDKLFNMETITAKVNESVSQLLKPSQNIPGQLETLLEAQASLRGQQEEHGTAMKQITGVVQKLRTMFESSSETTAATQKDHSIKLERLVSAKEPDQDVVHIKTSIERLEEGQKSVAAYSGEALELHKDVLSKVQSLPEIINSATTTLRTALTELIDSRNLTNRELEELRKANAEIQVQLTKARGAHGQVRVEKDLLTEKLTEVEAERERLRSQVQELQTASNAKTTETATLGARNAELQEALSNALARLQAADVASQVSADRTAELEKANQELLSSKRSLESKVNSLEMQIQFINRENETTTRSFGALQKQLQELQSQQSHWDTLRQTSERIQLLSNLLGQVESDELQELRRHRDQSKALETDHHDLQQQFKDLDNKFMASERNVATARQNLAQAQQRASDWERLAKETQSQFEAVRTELDQTEQSRLQLDADYALVKLQLEEGEAEGRAAKEREGRMRENIIAIENKARNLQAELEKAKTAREPVTPYRNVSNGYSHPPPRPDSRASTVYNDRSATPTRRMSSYTTPGVRSNTPPQPSVWDSMHAPARGTLLRQASTHIQAPTGRYPSNLVQGTPKAVHHPTYRPALPSPTPSTVSNAPTLREDGWYE